MNKSRYKLAVGLDYEGQSDSVPSVGAKGEHLIADEMVRIAKRFGIPVVERKEIAQALHALESDQEIPAELYETIAALLIELEKRVK